MSKQQLPNYEAFVSEHVLCNATALVWFSIRESENGNANAPVNYENIENNIEVDNIEGSEIYEWHLVDDFLADKLKKENEVIGSSFCGKYWGRTCCGQAIYLDSVIAKIAGA